MAVYDKMARYYDIIYSNLDHESQCNYIEQAFAKYSASKPTNVLDLGCGTGTHALNLAQRGYSVLGLDLSEGQIAIALEKKSATKKGEKADFVVADIRNFSFNKKFDSAISMFGSMGYLLTDDDLLSGLKAIHSHLQREGIFLFEFWNIAGVIPNHISWDRSESDDIKIIRLSSSKPNLESCTLEIEFDTYVLKDKELIDNYTEIHQLRIYSPNEMRAMLLRSGFDVVGIFDCETFDEPKLNSFRLTAIARAA